VASIGGNFGTQALTVSVRALSARELTTANAWRTLGREILTGLVTGGVVAFGLSTVTLIFFQGGSGREQYIWVVIALATMINFTMAALAGTLIPMCASKMGMDPAGASPIFVTLVTDFFGYLSFLGLAALLLL